MPSTSDPTAYAPAHAEPPGAFTDDTRPAASLATRRRAEILWLQLWLQTGDPLREPGGPEDPNRALNWGFVGGQGRGRTADLTIFS
jgi:hypothetical protein